MGGTRFGLRWQVLATSVAMVALGGLQTLTAAPAAAATPTDCEMLLVGNPNLVSNCGFESGLVDGPPVGWTLSPFAGLTMVGVGNSHSGTSQMSFGSSSDDSITQVVGGTTAGTTYELSFWLKNSTDTTPSDPGDFSAVVENTAGGDVTAVSLTDPEAFGYTEYDVAFRTQQDGGSPVLVFAGRNEPGWFYLDDVEIAVSHTVTFDAEGGLPTASPQLVHDGDYADPPADPALGGTDSFFCGWYTSPVGGTLWDFEADPVTSDLTLYAHYYLTGPPEGGSTGGTQVGSSVAALGASPVQSVFGQPVTFTVTVAPASPVKACSVLEWLVDGVQRGSDVPVASGLPVGGGLQYTLPGVTDLPVAQHDVIAYFPNCDAVPGAEITQLVVKAPSSTSVTYAGGTATATVRPTAPGAGSPAGSVTFDIGPSPVTTVGLGTDGTAQAAIKVPKGESLTAYYSGDGNFTPSSGALTGAGVVLNPYVAAQVRAVHGLHHGWYRSAVTVSFECKAGSAPLAGSCPSAVRLSKSRAAQSVRRTVGATDGGRASVTVSPINIDEVAPTLHVSRHGHELACHATDALSGVASCVVHAHSRTKGGVTTVRWTARAIDKAGNATTKNGHFAYVSP